MAQTPTYTLDSVVTDVDGVNEVQTITLVEAIKGSFTLTFDGETTSDIEAEEVSAEDVQNALLALGPFNSGDATVAGEAGGPFTVTFGGSYANQPVAAITASAAKLEDEEEKTPAEEGASEVTIAETTAGKEPGETTATQKGTGLADRTEDESPLAGESPNENREEEGEEYGDA